MKSAFLRLAAIAASTRMGLALLFSLLLLTVLAAGLPVTSFSSPLPQMLPHGPLAAGAGGAPRLSAALTQTTITQGTGQPVYFELVIDTPRSFAPDSAHKATSMVVVLDRSGSMGAENKLNYAKEAVRSLANGLNEGDQFALVAFDSTPQIVTPLLGVAPGSRELILSQINAISPGSATNIGGGLETARNLLQGDQSKRLRKVILLSDGQVNTGITDPAALAQLVRSMVNEGAVLSSIGMGLDFNETLMASLADNGSGNYTYLESLSGLGEVLAKDLANTRSIYARSSSIELRLPGGSRVLDAGGYLVEGATASTATVINTGQLLAGSKKQILLSVQLPAAELGRRRIEAPVLRYVGDAGEKTAVVEGPPLEVAVVEAERKSEALASINRPLMERAWQNNNFGIMKQKLAEHLRRGDRPGAESVMLDYNDSLKRAESEYQMPLNSARVEKDWLSTRKQVAEAFSGSRESQAVNQNGLAKANGLSGRTLQQQ